MWLFLSPHLDDAVWSCGGLLAQLQAAGIPALVWTLMAGDAPADPPQTPLVQELHVRWDVGEQPSVARRREDVEALQALGATWAHLSLLDAPYRVDADGNALYPVGETLFGAIHPRDPLATLELPLPDTISRLVAPLGVGGHVDHQVTHQLARRFAPSVDILYYEEYPYCAAHQSEAPYGNDSESLLSSSVRQALLAYADPLLPEIIPLTAAETAAKIRAMACYRSQISTFWANEGMMAEQVQTYMRQIASPFGERYWRQKENEEDV